MLKDLVNQTSANLLEIAANRILQLSPGSEAQLDSLDGKRIAVEIKDLQLGYKLRFCQQRLVVSVSPLDDTELCIAGNSTDFLQAGLAGNFDDASLRGHIQLQGNLQCARQLEKLLNSLEPDWYEPLCQWFGDELGYQMGQAISGFAQWLKAALANTRDDLSEALLYEWAVTPSRLEQDTFFQQVDELRSRVDRLQARIKRLSL